jgi:phage terminase large subunit-like protein
MSTPFSEREIQREFENAVDKVTPTADEDEITVRWGSADPEARPEGMSWDEETNTLTYDLWDAQRDILETLDGDCDVTGAVMGYGSGKSILGARWLLKQALEHDKSRFICMGQDYQKAKEATFKVLFEQLPGDRTAVVTSSYNGPEQSPVVVDYNRQDHRLTLVNDTVINLSSADRWNRLAGQSAGGVWLDEVAHYGDDLHDLLEMLGTRLRGEPGPQTQLWTTTGNGRQNAAYDILERGIDANGEPIGLEVDVVRASTLDNPYLDEETIERFKRQFGNTAREGQALHGGFAASTGTLLKRDQLTFVVGDDLPERNFRYRLGVDLSYISDSRRAEATDGDHTAVVCVAVDPEDNHAYLFDIARSRGDTVRQKIQLVADIANELPKNTTVCIEDTAAQQFFVDEARQSVPAPIQDVTPTESKTSRIQDMSVLFERDDVMIVNQEVDDNLGYDPRWRPLVEEWVQFGDSDDSPDVLDACWLALDGLQLGANANNGVSIYSGTYAKTTRNGSVF